MMGRDNAFTAIRTLAALAVVYAHSFPLVGLSSAGHWPGPNVGGFAVHVFFCISGYLVAASWSHDPDAGRFLVRRFPDGHFKLPHLWPPKLPQAGRLKL